MIELCPAGRGGTPDEVGTVGALLINPTADSSLAVTSSWTAVSPPPTGSGEIDSHLSALAYHALGDLISTAGCARRTTAGVNR
jgi:hypothetical protein